jgi:hypothetical protein
MKSSLKRVAAMMAGVAMMGAPVHSASPVSSPTGNVQSLKKDAVTKQVEPVRSVSRKQISGFSSNENNSGRFLNQRQYRKKCRQNPHLYKSKKHRSKN